MELKWLEDFCCLAGCLSFSRAAYLRGVTQPAFSRRIKAGWAPHSSTGRPFPSP